MIDYKNKSKKYRPQLIKTLLIGEAPSPNEKDLSYFESICVKDNV